MLRYDGPLLGLRVHGFGHVYFAYAFERGLVIDTASGRFIKVEPVPPTWEEVFRRYRRMSISLPNSAELSRGCD